jgi:hypothetical protein
MQRIKNILISPAVIAMLILIVLSGWVILQEDGDALALARIGTKFSQGLANGTEGYDGQFIYYMARDLDPGGIKEHLDVPAYRYQRILLPVLARIISLGNIEFLPWAILIINILAHGVGTWLLGSIYEQWKINKWYALVFGGWVGIGLATRLDLPEPLAYGLVIIALWAYIKKKPFLTWLFMGLAMFAKEVTIVFLLAFLLIDLYEKKWVHGVGMVCVACVPYGLFQLWLWSQFGQFGIGSGGAMATPFEVIPFMGLLRIGKYSLMYLLMMSIVFGPGIVFPSLWGTIISIKKWLKQERNIIVIALLLNSLAIMFMPFSTFRETGGLLRYSTGLVLSLTLFAAYYHLKKPINYSILWLVYIFFYFK